MRSAALLFAVSLSAWAQGPEALEFGSRGFHAEGLRLTREGKYFLAVKLLEAAEAADPKRAEIHTTLALNYYLLDQRKLFREEIAAALGLDPSSAQAWYLAGRFALEIDADIPKAIKCLRKTLELASASFKAHYYLGICYQDLGQPDRARSEFRLAAESGSYDWPLRALSELEYTAGNMQAALEAALEALKRNRASPESNLAAARAWQALGKDDAAVAAYQEAARLDPTWDRPHYYLGALFTKRGDSAAAAREFRVFEKLRNGLMDDEK